MAKKSAIEKNLRRIKLVKKYAKKREMLKKIINNKKLELSERFEAQLKLNKLPKNSAKIRIRNRCEISGRPHGVYRKLKISRIALRDMASGIYFHDWLMKSLLGLTMTPMILLWEWKSYLQYPKQKPLGMQSQPLQQVLPYRGAYQWASAYN